MIRLKQIIKEDRNHSMYMNINAVSQSADKKKGRYEAH